MLNDRVRSPAISRSPFRRIELGIAALVAAAATVPAGANNLGENGAWQFRTSADKATQAAILDMIARHQGGYYAAPVYNTTIARQVNCSIGASAVGNSNGQSAVANAPTVTGATSSATGNADTSSVDADKANGASTSQQSNSGSVTAGVTGATDTSVHGAAWQALNSSQSNSGAQNASVQNSNACSFAALN